MEIFSFNNYVSYLEYIRDHYPGAKRAISLDRWAKKLGYRSPRSIAMVLKGQRLPADEMVLAIAADLKLLPEERRYFELLVQKVKYAAKSERLRAVESELRSLTQKFASRNPLSAEIFAYVSEWYFVAIKQLVRTPSFREDPAWIAKRLQGKVTTKEVSQALETMLKLGVLQRAPDNSLTLSSKDLITAADIPSIAVRKHFRQQMERASEALDEQALQEREFTSLTLRISLERMEEAKKFLREFRDHFANEFESTESDEIAQLNLQFFFHTKDSSHA